jgi:hypothetical protein
MFDQINALLSIKKEIPDAVGYDTYGPVIFPVPKEVSDLLPGTVIQMLEGVAVFGLHVDNYSEKIQKNVKVLYSGKFEYAPKIAFRRRDVTVKYEVSLEDKKIEVFEIPPNESVDIEFFNPNKEFRIDRVIVGDTQITKLMQKLAEAKKYPGRMRAELLLYFFVFLALSFSVGAVFYAWKKSKEMDDVSSFFPKSSGCYPYIYENIVGHEAELIRKVMQYPSSWRPVIFSLNKVEDLESLKFKDKVLLCDPGSDSDK